MHQLPFNRLLVATANKGKIREFTDLLRPLGTELAGLADLPSIPAPAEIGTSFAQNAEIKATYYARRSGEWAIADDSGIEIDLLDGAPGVYSSRFGGEDATYETKMDLVLSKLDSAEEKMRTARFVCVIKVADPAGKVVITAEGKCEGTIARERRGLNGFGYDPIFIPAGFDLTFGELSDAEKRAVSHRGRAAEQLIRKMLDFTGL